MGEFRTGAGGREVPQFPLQEAQPGGLGTALIARREMRVRPVQLGAVQLAVDEGGQLLLEMAHGSPAAFPDPVVSGPGLDTPEEGGCRCARAVRSWARPRWMRLRTVPSFTPSVAAISS